MTLGLSREHRVSIALTIITLELSAGAMLAYTTYFLTSQITNVREAATASLDNQRDLFTQQLAAQDKRYNDQHILELQRIVTLETSAVGRDKAIDRLNVLVDQQEAILRDMAISQKSLEATFESMSKGKR